MVPGAVVGEFNSIESARGLIDDDTAAVLVEPIQGEGGINVDERGLLAGPATTLR